MRKHASTIILVVILLIGLCLLLYPSVSNWAAQSRMSRAVATYQDQVDSTDKAQLALMLQQAQDYNQRLVETQTPLGTNLADYDSVLDVDGSGVMGYLQIDKIDVKLPIYHGTDDTVLMTGLGHVPGSSLPVGGESTHAVLSGHRGLPSATLLSDLDQMEVGDTFAVHVLDQTLWYEVDKISVVLPTEVDELHVEEGADLCTLVTCTPYGVNSHRLLVRGHRIDSPENASDQVVSEAYRVDTLTAAMVIAVPILVALVVWVLLATRRKRRGDGSKEPALPAEFDVRDGAQDIVAEGAFHRARHAKLEGTSDRVRK